MNAPPLSPIMPVNFHAMTTDVQPSSALLLMTTDNSTNYLSPSALPLVPFHDPGSPVSARKRTRQPLTLSPPLTPQTSLVSSRPDQTPLADIDIDDSSLAGIVDLDMANTSNPVTHCSGSIIHSTNILLL